MFCGVFVIRSEVWVDRMIEISIENVEYSWQKTLLYFLNYIYDCEYQIDEKYVQGFIENYLGEVKRCVVIPKAEELRRNRQIKFIDRKIEKYEKKVEEILKDYRGKDQELRKYSFLEEGANSKIYNFCAFIIDCDRLLENLEEYIDGIECYCYKEAGEMLVGIQEAAIMLGGAITSFTLDMYTDNILDLSQNYMVMPDVANGWNAHKKIIACLERLWENKSVSIKNTEEEGKHLFPVLCLGCETAIFRKKIDVLKFISVFLMIIRSPEYSKEWKMYAYKFIEMYKDIFFCSTLHRVVIQRADLTGEASERGSEDNTTRMQLIFSLTNNDIYILRIDMPHKGAEKIHINMEECIKTGVIASGFPLKMDGEKFKELKEILGFNFNELFYIAGNRGWFKTNFLNKLNAVDLCDEKKEQVKAIFKEQSHKEIISEYDEEQVLTFLDEVKKYLERFQLTHMLQTELKRNNEHVYNEVKKIRKNLDNIAKCWQLMKERFYDLVSIREELWNLYGKQGLEEMKVCEENMEIMELSKIFDLISKHCV